MFFFVPAANPERLPSPLVVVPTRTPCKDENANADTLGVIGHRATKTAFQRNSGTKSDERGERERGDLPERGNESDRAEVRSLPVERPVASRGCCRVEGFKALRAPITLATRREASAHGSIFGYFFRGNRRRLTGVLGQLVKLSGPTFNKETFVWPHLAKQRRLIAVPR